MYMRGPRDGGYGSLRTGARLPTRRSIRAEDPASYLLWLDSPHPDRPWRLAGFEKMGVKL
jgi:hypothetical protein